jgi:hypothetical protein
LEATDGDNPVLRLSIDRIPESQDEINAQADGAIRDLFPRIPNTDREMIIQHAFQKGAVFKGKPVVGLQEDLTLSRRVQLAVIAHIRHTHTRYDLLLRETSWENARKAVESLCLDILVKWRGDEETGRDQLEEVLREVVVISDSEDEDETDSDEDEDSASNTSEGIEEVTADVFNQTAPLTRNAHTQPQPQGQSHTGAKIKSTKNWCNKANIIAERSQPHDVPAISSRTRSKTNPKQSRKAKKAQKGFRRYQAWQQAVSRRHESQNCGHGAAIEPPSAFNMRSSNAALSNVAAAPVTSGFQRTLKDYNDEPRFPKQPLPEQRPMRSVSCEFLRIVPGREYRHTKPSQTRSPVKIPNGQPMYSYEEKVIMMPDNERVRDYRQRATQDMRDNLPRRGHYSNASTIFTSHDNHPRDDVAGRLRRRASQDLPLPSIEPVTDLVASFPSSAHRIVDERPRYAEVRHPLDERDMDHSRPMARREIIYVDLPESQPKRRRILAEDDAMHFNQRGKESNRYEARPPQERYFIPISAGPDRDDYEGVPFQSRDGVFVGPEQLEPRTIPYQPVRVLRHAMDEGPSLMGLSLSDQPINAHQGDHQPEESYERLRAADMRGLGYARPRSTQAAALQETQWPTESVQLNQRAHQERAPQEYQLRIAGHEPFHSLSSLSNTHRSQEMVYDSVSAAQSSLRQVPVSHLRNGPESRQLTFGDGHGRGSPHQFPSERLSQRYLGANSYVLESYGFFLKNNNLANYYSFIGSYDSGTLRHPLAPSDNHRILPPNMPAPPDGRGGVVSRLPMVSAPANEPIYVRRVPRRDDVIIID